MNISLVNLRLNRKKIAKVFSPIFSYSKYVEITPKKSPSLKYLGEGQKWHFCAKFGKKIMFFKTNSKKKSINIIFLLKILQISKLIWLY